MRKFIVLFIAVFSAFVFNSCEDKEEITEYKYRLTANFYSKNIIIFEKNSNGDILKKHSIYELNENENSKIFTAHKDTDVINVYFEGYFLNERNFWEKRESVFFFNENINSIELSAVDRITQEEYEFYVNQ